MAGNSSSGGGAAAETAVAADSLILRKSSGLIAMDGAMSAIQHRAFNVLLHVAASSYGNNSPTGQLFRVSMKYLREKSGYTGGGNKARFLEEIIGLADIVVSGNLLGKAPAKPGDIQGNEGSSWRKFALVSEIRLSDNRRELLWAFPPTIMEEIVRPAVFGKIDLTAMFGLKPAALVIYELARDYVNVQIPKLDMDMLRKLTGYVDKYAHDSDFIKEVIEPAAYEAGSRMGMLITTERLHGNMVRFLMTPVEMAEKAQEFSYDDLIDMIPAEACNDVLKTTVWRHVTESGADYVVAQIEYIRNRTGIRCFAASLTSALKGDYAGFVKKKASKEKIAKEAARRERRQRRSASSAEAQAAKAELRAERAQKQAEIAQKAAEMAREKANSAAQKVQTASPAAPVIPTEPTATHELNQVEEVDDDPFSLDRIDNLYGHPHSVEYSDNLDDVPF